MRILGICLFFFLPSSPFAFEMDSNPELKFPRLEVQWRIQSLVFSEGVSRGPASEWTAESYTEVLPNTKSEDSLARVELQPIFGFYRQDGTDLGNSSTATFLSALSYGLQFGYQPKLFRELDTKLDLHFMQIANHESTNSDFSSSPGFVGGLAFGVGYAWMPELFSEISASVRQQYFLKRISISTLDFEKTILPVLTLKNSVLVFERNGMDLRGVLDFAVLGPGSVGADSLSLGYQWKTGLRFQQSWTKSILDQFHFQWSYGQAVQTSSRARYNNQDLEFSLGFEFDLNPAKEIPNTGRQIASLQNEDFKTDLKIEFYRKEKGDLHKTLKILTAEQIAGTNLVEVKGVAFIQGIQILFDKNYLIQVNPDTDEFSFKFELKGEFRDVELNVIDPKGNPLSEVIFFLRKNGKAIE